MHAYIYFYVHIHSKILYLLHQQTSEYIVQSKWENNINSVNHIRSYIFYVATTLLW